MDYSPFLLVILFSMTSLFLYRLRNTLPKVPSPIMIGLPLMSKTGSSILLSMTGIGLLLLLFFCSLESGELLEAAEALTISNSSPVNVSVFKVHECKLVVGDGKYAADLGLASVTVPDSSPLFNGVVLVEIWWRSGQDLQLLSCWMRNGVGGEVEAE